MSNVSITRINQILTKTIDPPIPITEEERTICAHYNIDRKRDTMGKKPPIHKIPEDKAPSKKRVHFAIDDACNSENDEQENKNTGAPPLWSTLTRETIEELWYQPSEISDMKAEAKYHVLHSSEASPDEICGLTRFTSQRALWKRSAIQYVLMSQKHKKGDEFVRRVSLRCSGWFREKACEQGFKDYCAVHDPLASLLDSDDVENYNECLFSNEVGTSRDDENKAKRSAPESIEGIVADQASKRRRTNAVEDENPTNLAASLDLETDNLLQ